MTVADLKEIAKEKSINVTGLKKAEIIAELNKETYFGSRTDLIEQGYVPCKKCNP